MFRSAIRLVIEQSRSVAHLGSFWREVLPHEDDQSYDNMVEKWVALRLENEPLRLCTGCVLGYECGS